MSDTTEAAETGADADEGAKKAKKDKGNKGGKSNTVPAIILALVSAGSCATTSRKLACSS